MESNLVNTIMQDVLETTELADDETYYDASLSLAIASCVKELEANGFGLVPKRGTVETSEPFDILGSEGEVVDRGRHAESVQLFFRDPELERTISVTISDER